MSAQWPLDSARQISSPSWKIGAHDADVVEVRAAEVGVVDREHVAGSHLAREGVDDRPGGQVQGADVDGDVLAALHDRVALGSQRALEKSRE